MILNQLKTYLEQEGTVSRETIANKFFLSEDGVDVMLAVWINKGLVTRLVDTNKKQEVIRVRYKLNPKDTLSLNVTM